MTLRHMIIFKEVCRLESISKAAESLNMAQPSVSLAIKELENYYNVRLFERMNRRIFITEKGQLLLNYADTIVNQFNEANELISDQNGTALLRVGSTDIAGQILMPGLLEDFYRDYPRIRVCTHIKNTEQITTMLQKNELDLALVDSITPSPDYQSKCIRKDRLIAVCGKKFMPELQNITIGVLSGLPLLYMEAGSGLYMATDSVFAAHGLTTHPIVESSNSEVLIQWALHNLGIFITHPMLVADNLAAGKLREIRIMDADFISYCHLVYHKHKYLDSSTRCLIDRLANI